MVFSFWTMWTIVCPVQPKDSNCDCLYIDSQFDCRWHWNWLSSRLFCWRQSTLHWPCTSNLYQISRRLILSLLLTFQCNYLVSGLPSTTTGKYAFSGLDVLIFVVNWEQCDNAYYHAGLVSFVVSLSSSMSNVENCHLPRAHCRWCMLLPTATGLEFPMQISRDIPVCIGQSLRPRLTSQPVVCCHRLPVVWLSQFHSNALVFLKHNRWIPVIIEEINHRNQMMNRELALTCSIRDISQGRAPLWASSTIFWRVESGNGRPFT